MALITTVAGATSDSYVTLVEAAAHASMIGETAFGALATDALRENLLRRATAVIDLQLWAGTRYDISTVTAGHRNGQALEFPRQLDVDGNGNPFVPVEVKRCCCEVAFALLSGAGETASDAKVSNLKIGGMTIEYAAGSEAQSVDSVDVISLHLGHRLARSVRF